MFADFGCIISSKILCNPKAGRQSRAIDRSIGSRRCPFAFALVLCIRLGTSKSVGFIRFDQRSEAEIAISKLNGTIPAGNAASTDIL